VAGSNGGSPPARVMSLLSLAPQSRLPFPRQLLASLPVTLAQADESGPATCPPAQRQSGKTPQDHSGSHSPSHSHPQRIHRARADLQWGPTLAAASKPRAQVPRSSSSINTVQEERPQPSLGAAEETRPSRHPPQQRRLLQASVAAMGQWLQGVCGEERWWQRQSRGHGAAPRAC